MNIANINARQLENGAIHIRYDEKGKQHEIALPSWGDFITWMQTMIAESTITE